MGDWTFTISPPRPTTEEVPPSLVSGPTILFIINLVVLLLVIPFCISELCMFG
jgi:hypothetical protein